MDEKSQTSIVCDICSKICRKRENRSEYMKTLIQHLRDQHGETLATSEGGKAAKCFVCDKRFRNEVSCKLHILDKHSQHIMVKQEQKMDNETEKHQPKMEIKVEIESKPTVKCEYFEEAEDVDLKPLVNYDENDDLKVELKLEETFKGAIYNSRFQGNGDENVNEEDNSKVKIEREVETNLITLKDNKNLFKPFPRPDMIRKKDYKTQIKAQKMLLVNKNSAVPNSAQYSTLPSLPPPQYQYMPSMQYRQAKPPAKYPSVPQPTQYSTASTPQHPTLLPPNQYPVIPASLYSVPPPGFPCLPPPPQFPPVHPSQFSIIPQDFSVPPPQLPPSWYSVMPPPLVPVTPLQCPPMLPHHYPGDRYQNQVEKEGQNQFGPAVLNQPGSSYCKFDNTGKLIQKRVRRSRWLPY